VKTVSIRKTRWKEVLPMSLIRETDSSLLADISFFTGCLGQVCNTATSRF